MAFGGFGWKRRTSTVKISEGKLQGNIQRTLPCRTLNLRVGGSIPPGSPKDRERHTCPSFAGYDRTLNVTAGLLTIIGHSVKDTIVIVDRVRENMRMMRSGGLHAAINLSVNQTLAHAVITAGTTFLAVPALYLFGARLQRISTRVSSTIS